jgi:TPR repeat protein
MANDSFLSHNELLSQEPDLTALQRAHRRLGDDRSGSIAELERLAAAGSVLSMMYLAQSFRAGPFMDAEKSKFWYERAFEKRAKNSIVNLGNAYVSSGEILKAKATFEIGVAEDDYPSMYRLARLYINHPHIGVTPDKIHDLLMKSHQGGQVRALNNLSFLYIKGRYGIKKIPLGCYYYILSLINGFRIGIKNPDDRRLW